MSPLVRGAEMRVAETRAVDRRCAKRMESVSVPSRSSARRQISVASPHERKRRSVERLRFCQRPAQTADKLCLLIRKYELDPSLVKRYAATSAEQNHSAMPAVISSKLSFPLWPRKPQAIVPRSFAS